MFLDSMFAIEPARFRLRVFHDLVEEEPGGGLVPAGLLAQRQKVRDKTFLAGGQEFPLISGANANAKYMYIAEYALKRM
jgi:hypothetical protein